MEYGLDQRGSYTLRLAGIDAPEISTNEGKISKAFVEDWLEARPHLLIRTIKDKREKYGRYLAYIYNAETVNQVPEPLSLNEVLVNEGLARPYDGGAR